MKFLFVSLMLFAIQAFAQVDRMDYDTIGGKDYFNKRYADPKSGKDVRWAIEFIESKDTVVIYKVEGEKMTAAASYLLKIDFEANFQVSQSFQAPKDKRPIFIVELRDRASDSRHLFVFDPLKDQESQSFYAKIRTDEYETKIDKDALKFEWYDRDSKTSQSKSWNSAR